MHYSRFRQRVMFKISRVSIPAHLSLLTTTVQPFPYCPSSKFIEPFYTPIILTYSIVLEMSPQLRSQDFPPFFSFHQIPYCVFRTKYPPIPAGKSQLIPVESPTPSPERSDEILFYHEVGTLFNFFLMEPPFILIL